MLQKKINLSIGKKNKGGTGLGRLAMGNLSEGKIEHRLSCKTGATTETPGQYHLWLVGAKALERKDPVCLGKRKEAKDQES